MAQCRESVPSSLWGRAELWIRQVALTPVVKASAPLLFRLASIWRRLLFRTTFIAVAGSVGKTTTKELLADILASRARTFRSRGNQNSGFVVPINVLRVRPWHRFAVLEIGIGRPGGMRPLARVVRPDVAVVLSIVRAHTTAFDNLEQYAAEKAILLDSVAPGGLVVLNGEDARVAGMAARAHSRVCMTGTSPEFEFWADEATSIWPERLRFRINHGDQAFDVQTRQLGTHWTPAMTAALAVATNLGIPLQDAALALRVTAPYTARLEPVALPSGPVFLRDDYSASIDSFEASLRVLRDAQAARRVLVLTDFSDSGMNRRLRLRTLAAAVWGWIGLLVVIGREHAYGKRKAVEAGLPECSVYGFETLKAAAEFLKGELRAGDLVLLKGRSTDHAGRLFSAQIGTVTCWRNYCPKTCLCDACWELGFSPNPDLPTKTTSAVCGRKLPRNMQ
jgi:UDP-N-acetylmuramoyl-tripeptide--D-alanyl-D-alanine ligase